MTVNIVKMNNIRIIVFDFFNKLLLGNADSCYRLNNKYSCINTYRIITLLNKFFHPSFFYIVFYYFALYRKVTM